MRLKHSSSSITSSSIASGLDDRGGGVSACKPSSAGTDAMLSTEPASLRAGGPVLSTANGEGNCGDKGREATLVAPESAWPGWSASRGLASYGLGLEDACNFAALAA